MTALVEEVELTPADLALGLRCPACGWRGKTHHRDCPTSPWSPFDGYVLGPACATCGWRDGRHHPRCQHGVPAGPKAPTPDVSAAHVSLARQPSEVAAPDLGPRPAPEVAARPATPEELPRFAASLVKESTARMWTSTATYARGYVEGRVYVEDPGAPLTPTGRVARKVVPGWSAVDSVLVRLTSPYRDRAVFVFEGTSCVEAWVAPRGGHPVSVGYKPARAFVLGPWEDDMPHVPAWRRELIANAARVARPATCPACSTPVLVGVDNYSAQEPSVVEAEPLDPEHDLSWLVEVAAFLGDRGVFSLIPGPGGKELHSRDTWHLGERRWPTHLGHQCPAEQRSAS